MAYIVFPSRKSEFDYPDNEINDKQTKRFREVEKIFACLNPNEKYKYRFYYHEVSAVELKRYYVSSTAFIEYTIQGNMNGINQILEIVPKLIEANKESIDILNKYYETYWIDKLRPEFEGQRKYVFGNINEDPPSRDIIIDSIKKYGYYEYRIGMENYNNDPYTRIDNKLKPDSYFKFYVKRCIDDRTEEEIRNN